MLCLWEWGTLPRLGSVHPPMGGSELSPSPSLNVSPLCKGLPGQVGLPGEIGVPGPKVRGGGVPPAPASASQRLLGPMGETPSCVWASLTAGTGCAPAAGFLCAAPHPMARGCLHSQCDAVPHCPSPHQLWQLLNPPPRGCSLLGRSWTRWPTGPPRSPRETREYLTRGSSNLSAGARATVAPRVCISTADADGLLPYRAPQDTSKEWREAQISW